jgi:hypothetical protein
VNGWYRAAIFCGAAPLLTGTAIFLLWTITRWRALMDAGLWVIVAGVGLSVTGCIALIAYIVFARRDPSLPRRTIWMRGTRAAFLLLANYPVAAVILSAAIAIETRYTVTIHNHSSHPIEQARIEGGGVTVSFGAVAPGASVRRTFHFQDDGTLEFSGVYQGRIVGRQIESYVTSGLGGDTEIALDESGRLRVDRRAPWAARDDD